MHLYQNVPNPSISSYLPYFGDFIASACQYAYLTMPKVSDLEKLS